MNNNISSKPGGEDQPVKPEETPYQLEPIVPNPKLSGLGDELPKGRVIARDGEAVETDVGPKRSKVGEKGLIDDFDEDADFTSDPEVERAAGQRTVPTRNTTQADETPAASVLVMVKSGLGSAEQVYMVAGGVALAAVITAGFTAASRGRVWYADCILTAYMTALHAITGAAAIMAAAHLLERRLGELPLATARMALAVALFQLVFHLNIPLQGRWDESVAAVLTYIITVWGLFRWSREHVTLVLTLHGAMWLAVYLAGVLWQWSFAAIVPKPS